MKIDDFYDHTDWALLRLANEKQKFALGLDYVEPSLQTALERAFDFEWVRLIDVVRLAQAGGHVCRIFKLTSTGFSRRQALAAKFGTP